MGRVIENCNLPGPENLHCSVPVYTLEPGYIKEGGDPEIALVLFWQFWRTGFQRYLLVLETKPYPSQHDSRYLIDLERIKYSQGSSDLERPGLRSSVHTAAHGPFSCWSSPSLADIHTLGLGAGPEPTRHFGAWYTCNTSKWKWQ